MRWRKRSLDQIVERLTQLGLVGPCHVCSSGIRSVSRRPVILPVGGFPRHDKEDPRHDPEANVHFTIAVGCDVCGTSNSLIKNV